MADCGAVLTVTRMHAWIIRMFLHERSHASQAMRHLITYSIDGALCLDGFLDSVGAAVAGAAGAAADAGGASQRSGASTRDGDRIVTIRGDTGADCVTLGEDCARPVPGRGGPRIAATASLTSPDSHARRSRGLLSTGRRQYGRNAWSR